MFYRQKKLTKAGTKAVTSKFQEGHRLVVWEGDKNTQPSLHHYEVIVNRSFLQAEEATRIKSVVG